MTKSSINDYWWKSYFQKTIQIVSLKDGSRNLLDTGNNSNPDSYAFSPEGKYVTYFTESKNYFSYNLLSGKTLNISASITMSLNLDLQQDGLCGAPPVPVGIAGWLAEDSAVLIYDNYDIWQIDPTGIRPPINVTNGYGIRHRSKLRLVSDPIKAYTARENLLLTAFNTSRKYNGFFRHKLGKKGDPELLDMGPYVTYLTNTQTEVSMQFKPLKASRSKKWVVMRQSVGEAPNFYFTTNFVTYTKLTDIQPHKRYNWLTAELISFQQMDGTFSQGILYKPENFDSKKRYPIIFKYYQKMSQSLYEYPQPTFSVGDINIPWMVSRGYLVFFARYSLHSG